MQKRHGLVVAALTLLWLAAGPALAWQAAQLTYSKVHDLPSGPGPRDARGLSMDSTGTRLVIGYNNLNPAGEGPTRMVRLSDGVVTGSVAHRGKSIVADDWGRLYVAYGSEIRVYNQNMHPVGVLVGKVSNCEGLAFRREGGVRVLYASDRNLGVVRRLELVEVGYMVVDAVQAGLDGDGQLSFPSTGVRGIWLASDGMILGAKPTDNPATSFVYRLSPDGGFSQTVACPNPYYMTEVGGSLVVSGGYGRDLHRFAYPAMTLEESFSPDWTSIGIVPPVLDWEQAVTGLLAHPDGQGFWFTLESGHTLDDRREPIVSASLGTGGDVEAHEQPGQFNLSAHPNPFNPLTTLSYTLPETGTARLEIYNLAGTRVAVLAEGRQEAGLHQVRFTAQGLPSGVYISRLRAGVHEESARLLLLK